MNGWSVAREPEKPKTLTGRRELAKKQASEVVARLKALSASSDVDGAVLLSKSTVRQAVEALEQLVTLYGGAGRVVSDEL